MSVAHVSKKLTSFHHSPADSICWSQVYVSIYGIRASSAVLASLVQPKNLGRAKLCAEEMKVLDVTIHDPLPCTKWSVAPSHVEYIIAQYLVSTDYTYAGMGSRAVKLWEQKSGLSCNSDRILFLLYQYCA